ncbi:MAG: DUF3500 domain-containing protein [Gemmataceae bacterium]|nr:DUF3500 domain-containing protein [Gemmataceae bacterium]
MSENSKAFCPECNEHVEQTDAVDRRTFLTAVGGQAASALIVGGLVAVAPSVVSAQQATPTQPPAGQPATPARTPRPAEELIRELYRSLTPEQRTQVVRPWNHGAENGRGTPTRQRMYNRPLGRNIGQVYTPAQRELNQRILRAIASDEAGYSQLSRNGTFDGSRSFDGCGADIFGDPTTNQFAWVFSGHHLTVRCDGNSQAGAAFGGPMYYGHSPDGYSARNCFNYQTRSVLSVFEALNEQQRRQAVVVGSPGELEPSIRFRPRGERHPGVAATDLTHDQRQLVRQVMRTVLSPYRREDADEVMEIIGRNGGMERLHLAFYRDRGAEENARWHFWRIEGPGFVWNYRVLPHVHTYVNISSEIPRG